MSNYGRRYSDAFENDVKALKKHRELIERLQNKIEEVLKCPNQHKPYLKCIAFTQSQVLLLFINTNKGANLLRSLGRLMGGGELALLIFRQIGY